MLRRLTAPVAAFVLGLSLASIPANAADDTPTPTPDPAPVVCRTIESANCEGTFATHVRQGLLMRSLNGGPWEFVTPTSYYTMRLGQYATASQVWQGQIADLTAERDSLEVQEAAQENRVAVLRGRVEKKNATIARLRKALARR